LDVGVIWIGLVAGLAALCLLVGIAAWLTWRYGEPDERKLIKRIAALPLRSKLRLALALMRDRRIPLAVRAIPPGLVLYLLMPVDLIPDFIPVVGYLDDLLILLVGIGLLMRITPRHVLDEQLRLLETRSDTG
jgi:uncharacterized membrane protein YkvA (DUF1232 family)